ncbi:MAG: cation diffusion facilitator family transporter [Muribaculaceae bacterium]|nr:cation diffusion facilitator family transporter [Muribaculaceae bacterium]
MINNDTIDEMRHRASIARKCTWIGFIVNGILAFFKIIAGIFGRSGAMIADGIHSLSDFITDVIVIVFIGVSAKGVDKFYRYGHGKFETFATMLISVALALVAVGLFYDGLNKVLASLNGEIIDRPSYIALIMALISIISKEWLFKYTKKIGNDIRSMALIANAWHHRSDAMSSIATLVGISGAIFLSEQWRILDPLAAMLVSVFIIMVAWKLGIPAIKELLEVSLPEQLSNEIGLTICSVDGVKTYHNLRTRKNGNIYVLDFHIKVDPTCTIVQAHDISTAVEHKLIDKYGKSFINIHIEPYMGEEIKENGCCID